MRGEIVALAALPPHPGIMRMALCLAMTDKVALITEYIKGTTLQAIVSGARRLRADVLRVVVAQLVCAVGVCHEAGILHRDIKPANILVDSRTGHVKIIDFGLSVPMRRPRGSKGGSKAGAAGGSNLFGRSDADNMGLPVPQPPSNVEHRDSRFRRAGLASAASLLKETHVSSTSTRDMQAQLAAVSPCMTIGQAHQKMANLQLVSQGAQGHVTASSSGSSPGSSTRQQLSPGQQGPRQTTALTRQQSSTGSESAHTTSSAAAYPKPRGAVESKEHQRKAPLRPMTREAPNGTRMLAALTMLVFDQSIAGDKHVEYLRRAGRRHRRVRSKSSSTSVGASSSSG